MWGRPKSTGEPREMQEPRLPKFDYYLDETDPDVVVLRRQDGSFVAAFSARGVTKEGIVEAAEEDYRALLEERARSYDRASEQERGRLEPRHRTWKIAYLLGTRVNSTRRVLSRGSTLRCSAKA